MTTNGTMATTVLPKASTIKQCNHSSVITSPVSDCNAIL